MVAIFQAKETEGKDEFKYVYNMTYPKQGLAVIINNRIFEGRTQMGKGAGTDVNAANLYQVFKKLGLKFIGTTIRKRQIC